MNGGEEFGWRVEGQEDQLLVSYREFYEGNSCLGCVSYFIVLQEAESAISGDRTLNVPAR